MSIQSTINGVLGAAAGGAAAIATIDKLGDIDKTSKKSLEVNNDALKAKLIEGTKQDVALAKDETTNADRIYSAKEDLKSIKNEIKSGKYTGDDLKLLKHDYKIGKQSLDDLKYERTSIQFQRDNLRELMSKYSNQYLENTSIGGKK